MSAPLVLLAPLKVNLFLEVLRRRDDGYHEICTVMEALDIGDRVRVEPAETLEVTADRDDVPDGESNLAAAMVREAERRLGRALPARISIAKLAPPGSGLGAGSSDGVTALEGVLQLHGITTDTAFRESVAAAAGSDTVFFVTGGTALCTGRGEIVEPLTAAGTRHYTVIWGGPPAPTGSVYGEVDLASPRRDGQEFVRDLTAGKLEIFNRLEEAAFKLHPALRDLAAELERGVQRKPWLTGSGSAFYILAGSRKVAEAIAGEVRSATGLEAHAAATYIERI